MATTLRCAPSPRAPFGKRRTRASSSTALGQEAGVHVEVISGVEEARLIHLGVLQAVPVFDRRLLLVDIGGGSTELLIGESGDTHRGAQPEGRRRAPHGPLLPWRQDRRRRGQGLPQPCAQPHRTLPPRRHDPRFRRRRGVVGDGRDGRPHRPRGERRRTAADVQLLRVHPGGSRRRRRPCGQASHGRQRGRRCPGWRPTAPTSSSPAR